MRLNENRQVENRSSPRQRSKLFLKCDYMMWNSVGGGEFREVAAGHFVKKVGSCSGSLRNNSSIPREQGWILYLGQRLVLHFVYFCHLGNTTHIICLELPTLQTKSSQLPAQDKRLRALPPAIPDCFVSCLSEPILWGQNQYYLPTNATISSSS